MVKSKGGPGKEEADGGSTKGGNGEANGSSTKGKTSKGIITSEMISETFKGYILHEKPGLQRFYKADTLDNDIKEPVERALKMAKTIKGKGCPWETALSLSLIALYDLVMLLGTNCLRACSSGHPISFH